MAGNTLEGGIYTLPNGRVLKGIWKNGTYTLPDGKVLKVIKKKSE